MLYLASVPFFLGCGTPTNSDIPGKASDLTKNDSHDPILKAQNDRWEALATALGIQNNQAASGTALNAQLATPSNVFDANNSAKLEAWTDRLTDEHTKNTYATRCKSIESLIEITDYAGGKYVDATGAMLPLGGDSAVKVFQIQYKLQKNAAGEGEDRTRSGLLVIPTGAKAGSAPFVSFGHGGDQGLGYWDIARMFGQLQNSHIVLAPTFPSEPLCKSRVGNGGSQGATPCQNGDKLADGIGTLSPYDNDVDELLGLHDCAVKASTPINGTDYAISAPITGPGGGSVGSLNATLAGLVRRSKAIVGVAPDGSPVVKGKVPVSYVTGTSRGGLVANIALAKTGAALKILSRPGGGDALSSRFGPNYSPTLFSCAAALFPPSSFAIAEFRMGLERIVKGTAGSTNFTLLPTFPALNAAFDEYRNGTITADDAALRVAKRDTTFNSALISLAVRNWSTKAPGPFMMLHGLKDLIVPFSQSWSAGQIISQVSSAVAKMKGVPGLKMTVLGLAPDTQDLADPSVTDVTKQTLKSGFTDHGDLAYAHSKAAIDLTAPNLITPAPQALLGKSSAELLSNWFLTGDCSVASDPVP